MASRAALAFLALGFEREVDHHDGVLFDDADQQHDADQRDDAEIRVADHQRQQRAHARGRQRRKNRDRVDVAFVQHAQDDVDRHQRGQNQNRLVGQRIRNAAAVPWKLAWMLAGMSSSSLRVIDRRRPRRPAMRPAPD